MFPASPRELIRYVRIYDSLRGSCKPVVIIDYNEYMDLSRENDYNLINLTNEVKSEGENKGVQIIIDLEASEDEKTIHKKIEVQVLESGGHGCISGFDPIYEMTQEEILDIP